MGMIYRPKYRRTDGTVVESAVWWVKYYRDGRPIRETTETTKEGEARRFLRQKEADADRGAPYVPKASRVTFAELAGDVVTDYRINERRSLDVLDRRLKLHVLPVFGHRRAASITTADLRKFVEKRQDEKASNAEINRELAAIGRAFSLGLDAGKVVGKPKIPLLEEKNVRQGFFEAEQFDGVRAKLPAYLQALVTFAYVTGWRIRSEALPLQWRQVDFAAGWVRLDPGTTKNGEGRVFPFTSDLRALLEGQREHTRAIERERGIIVPWVFHRKGERIGTFYKAWGTACRKAGCPGRIPHDFRRTAIRNLVRAGIPESVAMKLSGHQTRSVFERYNVTSEGDLLDAAAKLDAVKKPTGKVAGKVVANGAFREAWEAAK